MSESSSSQSSSSQQTTSTVSKPVTLQDVSGVTIAGAEGSVNVTDGGAVNAMGNVSMSAIEQAAKLTLALVDKNISVGQAALRAVVEGQQSAQSMLTDFGAPESSALRQQSTIMMVAIGVGAVLAAIYIWKS